MLSFLDGPLTFSCSADHVPDWQPRILLGMFKARSVNVKNKHNTHTQTLYPVSYAQFGGATPRENGMVEKRSPTGSMVSDGVRRHPIATCMYVCMYGALCITIV